MTRYYDEKIRKQPQRVPPPSNNNNIIIGDNYAGRDDIREYICENCQYTINGRISANEIYCNHCSSSFVVEDVRKKGKLEVPREHTGELYINHPPGTEYFAEQIKLKKEPQLKGGALALSKKGGIRFTSYVDSSAGKENAD